MTPSHTTILEKDMSELFAFNELSQEERAELLDGIGATIMESAVLRFITEREEDEVARFETFLEEYAENTEMLTKLGESFPQFVDILEEEVRAFKEEAVAILE